MLRHTLALLFLSLLLLAPIAGCDTRPKVVMPTSPVFPAPKPRSTGGGGEAAQPAMPGANDQVPVPPARGDKDKQP
jgi:hypothetical protein